MLDRIRRFLPENYDFMKSEWYQKIGIKQTIYRYRLLVTSLFTASLFPLAYAIDDVLHGNFRFTSHYILPFIIVVASLIWIIKTKNIKFMTFLALFLCFIGVIAGMFFPAGRQVNILVFFCMPMVAFQLLGSRKGIIIAALFLAMTSLLFILQYNNILPSFTGHFTKIQFIMSVVAFFLSSVLVYFGEHQNETYMDDLVKKIVYDDTTGLPNRLVLENSIDLNKTSLFAIVHIANYNELGLIFGYELSDDFLLFLTGQLNKWKNTFGFRIYRMRGTEFGILMPFDGKNEEEGEIILLDLWTLLQKDPVPFQNSGLRLNLRMGAVIVNRANADKFLSLADMALKTGIKQHNPVTIFKGEEFVKQSALTSISQFTILLKNYEEKLFKAFYQPIVHSKSGKTVWYESLLRIQNSSGIYESPFPYLSIAESTGMVSILTDFMVEQAFYVSQLTNTGISVNISFHDMLSKNLVDFILKKCQTYNSSGKVIFEILERDELIEIEGCRNFINTVREAGCLVAIDDFGSGYSNFSNLLTIPTDIVKIDGSLIKQVTYNINARNMIGSIVQFCKKSDKKVVAEYVETSELAEELKNLDVDFLQGYFFGEPRELSYYNIETISDR